MSKFQIDFSEKKNPDWIIAQLKGVEAPNLPYADVSINRTGKKGDVFPQFDQIMTGHTIEGEIWQSNAGKWYLFPPKVATTGNSTKGNIITKSMQKKDESITKFQGNKEQSIKVASTMSMACQTALAFLGSESIKDIGVFKSEVKRWRDFYWSEWDK